MHDFLYSVFRFMDKQGSYIIVNIIILYGIPFSIGFCGLLLTSRTSKSIDSIGRILILLSVVMHCVLAVYAIIFGFIITAICGFVMAGSAVSYWLFADNKIARIKKDAESGDIDSLIEMGKETFITDKNVAAQYFKQAAERGNAEAQYRLGRMYYEFFERKQEGIEWLEKSATQNYKYAIDKLNDIKQNLK